MNGTYQVLIGLTLLAYFNVLADMFTQKMRRLVVAADTEEVLARIRDRLRALLGRFRNNSVSPVVEEINLDTGNTGNTAITLYSMAADNEQNQNGLKDHIRYYV